MEGRKYERFVKPLSIGETERRSTRKGRKMRGTLPGGPGEAIRKIRMNGRDHLEGLNLNFSWGIHGGLGEWHAGFDPHAHPYPSCLMFVGLDTANVNYLGAAINLCLGSEQETYSFNEPTAIALPSGLAHGPVVTERIYSPKGFGVLTIELNSVSEIAWFGESAAGFPSESRKSVPEGVSFASAEEILKNKPVPPTGKYAHLMKSLKEGLLIERGGFVSDLAARADEHSLKGGGKLGPGSPDHLIWIKGKELGGMDANILWGFCSRPGIWRRGAESQTRLFDEVLVYIGTDPNHMDSLGAEIEIDMGIEHERYLINKPSAVVCPAGTPHPTQVTRWVDKPFAFLAVGLSGEYKPESFD